MRNKDVLTNRNFGLDLVRSIAIIGVLLCHTVPIFAVHIEGKRIDQVFNVFYWSAGYYGVEIFFILSGYLIGTIFIKTIVNNDSQESKKKDILNFWIRRWFRTLPNFLLFFFVFWVLVYALGQQVPSNYLLLRVVTLTHGIFYGGSDFYGVSWSLAVEEWFYILLPVFFMGFFFVLRKNKNAFLGALAMMLFIPSALKIFFTIENPVSDYAQWVFHYSTLYKLDSIFYGLLLAYIWQNNTVRNFLHAKRNMLFLIGLAGTVLSLFMVFKYILINVHESIFMYCFQIVCSVSLLLTFPFFIGLQSGNQKLVKTINFFSVTSYSLYLVHMPILFTVEYLGRKYNATPKLIESFFIYCIVWILSLALANLIYKYFELPFLRIRDKISLKITAK